MAQKYGSYRNLIVLVVVLIALVIGALALFSGMTGSDNNTSKEATKLVETELKEENVTVHLGTTMEETTSDIIEDKNNFKLEENVTEEIESVELDLEDKNETTIEDVPAVKPAIEVAEPFLFTPQKPASNGKLKATIELGAQGFNCFVIKLDKNRNWELKKAEYNDDSLLYEGLANIEDIKSGLRAYIGKIINEEGVHSKDIHFLVSSGALLKEKTPKIVRAVKNIGFIPNEITLENESKYAFWATIPKHQRENSFVVDIGSGNTKVAWMDNGKLKTIETPLYGAKYSQDGDNDDDVYNSIKNTIIDKIPESNRKRCFMIGGVPHKLAKTIRKDKELYTTLYSPKTYLRDPDKYKLNKKKKIQCGLNIYQAIKDATETEQFIFYWNTNFTIGYLLRFPY